MVEKSQSAPGAFAAAVRKADPRSRAEAGHTAPPPTQISHGHETGEAPPVTPRPGQAEPGSLSVLEQLQLGRPRNADGSPRDD
jgi:hypothetical protein